MSALVNTVTNFQEFFACLLASNPLLNRTLLNEFLVVRAGLNAKEIKKKAKKRDCTFIMGKFTQ